MRSVPHRVVCLLGLDDGVFPRQTIRDGDDVLARDPWVGERDPRSEDRQLLLDAICAAGEHLVITYTGADERTGAAGPAGRAARRAARRPRPDRDRRRRTPGARRRHDPPPAAALRPAQLRPGRSRGDGRSASTRSVTPAPSLPPGRGAEPAPFLPGPLPPAAADDVALEDLLRLLAHPARGFLRQRLQVAATRAEDEPADALPVELDALEQWAVGDRLLAERLAGLDAGRVHRARAAPRRRCRPARSARRRCARVGRRVDGCCVRPSANALAEPEPYDVDVALGDGTRLSGTVTGVRGDVSCH